MSEGSIRFTDLARRGSETLLKASLRAVTAALLASPCHLPHLDVKVGSSHRQGRSVRALMLPASGG